MSPVSGVDGDVVDDGIINAFSQPPLGMADDDDDERLFLSLSLGARPVSGF